MFKKITFALVTVLFLMLSCDVSDDSSTENGTLRVYLTDAPADYEAVWIDIEEVRIHRNGNEDIEDEDDGWIAISDEPMKVNLLDLTNGEFEVLGETELEAGNYSQIRLILGDENEIVKDGMTHALTTPSAQQSGLKININAEIEGGQVYTLLLDFDASRSVVEAGKSGMFILKPVLRVVELENTGAIAGNIQPAEALPWIYAVAGEDTVAGTKADGEGDFLIVGLLSDSYQLSVEASEGDYSSLQIPNVEVTAPDTTEVEPIILEENQE